MGVECIGVHILEEVDVLFHFLSQQTTPTKCLNTLFEVYQRSLNFNLLFIYFLESLIINTFKSAAALYFPI